MLISLCAFDVKLRGLMPCGLAFLALIVFLEVILYWIFMCVCLVYFVFIYSDPVLNLYMVLFLTISICAEGIIWLQYENFGTDFVSIHIENDWRCHGKLIRLSGDIMEIESLPFSSWSRGLNPYTGMELWWYCIIITLILEVLKCPYLLQRYRRKESTLF